MPGETTTALFDKIRVFDFQTTNEIPGPKNEKNAITIYFYGIQPIGISKDKYSEPLTLETIYKHWDMFCRDRFPDYYRPNPWPEKLSKDFKSYAKGPDGKYQYVESPEEFYK